MLGLLNIFEKFDTTDQFHGEEALGVISDEIVEMDEVWVGEIGECAKFFFEAVMGFCVGGFEFFEGDFEAHLVIESVVDDAESAFTEAAEDLVAAIVEPTGILWCVGELIDRHGEPQRRKAFLRERAHSTLPSSLSCP